MKKLENILAENMRRFNTKNLTEQAVDTSVENITRTFLQGLEAGKPTIIDSAGPVATNIYVFPVTDIKTGDIATDAGKSAIYPLGNGQYVVVGQLGTLNFENKTVSNPKPQVLTFIGGPSPNPGAGPAVNISPIKTPISAARPDVAIARLAKAYFSRSGTLDKSYVNSPEGKVFIQNMVNLFKLVGLATEISDMNAFNSRVSLYL
jgi:hypothetical protein